MLWHACSEGLVFDRDEGVAVFFDPASGNTHLIDDFALKILRILSVSPLSSEAIKKECTDQMTDLDDNEQGQFIDDMLHELHSLDLIE